MPSVYGDTVNHFRAKLDYSTSQSNTAVSITAAAYMCSVAWGFDVSYVTSTVTINGSSSSTTTGFYSANGATVEKSMVSKTVSVSRGTSAKTVSLSAVVNNHSGYMNGTSTASATVTIPALSSYSVTYDANGGTGAPSSQTKWYGTTLTLSSTRPTREGYTFLSWNTSASGTGTSYAPGASYTANAALTLYAQWEQDYVAPSVTAASAYRVASSGSTAEDVSGAYAYASFSWAVDTTLTSGNTASSVTLAHRASGASSWTSMTASGTTSGTSGTVYGWFEADEGTSYEVRVSVTDTSGADGSTATLTRTVGVASVPLSMGSAGRAVGILSVAPEEGLAIGGASVGINSDSIELNWGTGFLGGRVFDELWSGTWTGGSITVSGLPYYNVFAIGVSMGLTASSTDALVFAMRSTPGSDGTVMGGAVTASGTDGRVCGFQGSVSGTTFTYTQCTFWQVSSTTNTNRQTERPVYAIYGVI